MSTYRTPSDSHTPLINVSNTNTANVTRSSLPPRRMLSNGGHYHLRRRLSSTSDSSSSHMMSPSHSNFADYKSAAGFFSFKHPSTPRLGTLYQSSSLSESDSTVDAIVVRNPPSPSRHFSIRMPANVVTFSSYAQSPRSPSIIMCPRTPSVASYSSSMSATTPPSSIASPKRPSPTVIIQRQNTTYTQMSMIQKIQPCSNMVHNKCRCKEILAQNGAALRVWSGCHRMMITNPNYAMDHREIEVSYFDGLYKGLCEYLKQRTDSDRVPTKGEISNVIQQFGGFTLANGEVVMDRCHFVSFWKWFRGSCQILKDLYTLWDTKYPFQLNLFMDRKQCEEILRVTSHGTFLVRLSSRQNALVVSYSEQIFDRSTKIRHILLVRKSLNNYMAKTNKNSHKCSEINKLIRSFAKLQFIYTPRSIYKKSSVF